MSFPPLSVFGFIEPSLVRGRGFAKGWATSPEEFVRPVAIAADAGARFPAWLDGVLVRNGPGMFEVGPTRVNHQFDGLAKLNKFNFSEGRVYYQSRFLNSGVYNRTMRRGRLLPHLPMLPTTPRFRYIDRVMSLFSRHSLDNNNINVHQTGDTLYATSDSSASSVFDLRTLETLGPLDAAYTRHISAAHPQTTVGDAPDTINFLCDPTTLRLQLYRDSPGAERVVIGEVQLDHLPLTHSFAVSEDYAILFHYPLMMDTMALLSGASSVVEIMRWQTHRDVLAFVFDLRPEDPTPAPAPAPAPVFTFSLPSFFSMHCVNAFQIDAPDPDAPTRLVVDLVAYKDADFVASADTYGQLDLMREPERLLRSKAYKMTPELRRIHMKLKPSGGPRGARAATTRGTWVASMEEWDAYDAAVCTTHAIPSIPFEMPAINRDCRGLAYRFVYGVTTSRMFQKWGITKTCTDGTSRQWAAPSNHFPSEPIFVPSPQAEQEDEGVLLSIVLDARKDCSYILCLDASSLSEIARAYLPVIIPFDVHGRWVPRHACKG